MRIAILGYGVEGRSAEKYLKSSLGGGTAKCAIEIRDVKFQGKSYLKGLDKFDMIVRSPGVPYLTLEIQRAKKAGVEITSATKLFFEHKKGRVIGITGTKGKGTTATLLFKILKAAGKNVYLTGNIGRPMLDILPRLNKKSITILELSSFQLQDLDYSPEIAIITDISPDHLNYHRSFKEYLEAKFSISNFQFPKNKVFYFPDNKYSKLVAEHGNGKKIAVMPNPSLILKIPGSHNIKNASMAAATAHALGVHEATIKRVVRNFSGLPHRLEFVREVNGVRYYNDSASTNPAAAVAALAAFNEPKILIAGGAGKNLSYKPLGQAITKSKMRAVILFGRDKHKIKRSIKTNIPVKLAGDLESAVIVAKKLARNGDVVVFSPAAASFDMFKNYSERGNAFKKNVRQV